MEAEAFRTAAREMIDYVIDYLEGIRDRRVLPTVEPGYMRGMLPEEAPREPEPWSAVLSDIERVIMPGVTHWHSPHFHAFYPTANSYPGILADILSGAIACIGFTWQSSPACTELEMNMMDWLGKLLALPKEFLFCSGGKGGGVIQGTASEATLVALLAAKARTVKAVKAQHPEWNEASIAGMLVAYTSEQAHCSVERAGMLGGMKMHLLETGESLTLTGAKLEEAVKEDLARGLIPCYVVATLGTTTTCAFDDILSIGPVCEKFGLWLHIDAAYAGAAFICPEFRHLLNGVEYAESFNFNPHKWMLVNFDCSALWFKDASLVVDAFNVDPVYLKHDQQGVVPDYRHWQIPLGRRFRSLKLWFVFRLLGVEGIQENVRKHVRLARRFHRLLLEDPRFSVPFPPAMGLVCFRLEGSNERSKMLLNLIRESGKIFLVPGGVKETFFLRFSICARTTTEEDVDFAWREIQSLADQVAPDV
ncbi:unnamed protein product [Darwinula stevensoni]|uniref:Aromatic-L-amino-acid decarboxylase n=1 Tax=Darwinula stevensoni TaxID=69355 RepID=A0A7R8X1F9_9CRUS|nr:unnamed protein product [Darwinula stevensoni]CAG0882284.1 unnamed protein product [Darwinula stevensoni]